MKKILLGALVLGALWFVWCLFSGDPVSVPEQTDSTSPLEGAVTVAEFISTEGESVTIAFAENAVALTGLGYTDLILPQAVAASGARYELAAEGLEVWNKGESVTISKNGEALFVGSIPLEDDELQLLGTWVWRHTLKQETVSTTPVQPGAFTITFEPERVSGTTDCNGFMGGYNLADGVLSFEPLAMTKKFCEGSQEMVFVGQFEKTPIQALFEGSDTLALILPDGSTAVFDRAK